VSNPSPELSGIRSAIDALDTEIIALIAARQRFVEAAGVAKAGQGGDAVRAPARVETVIARVREQAVAAGASPAVVEAAYRAMIAAFIDLELGVHAGGQ
jgi:isochorismate pyruvate lyase